LRNTIYGSEISYLSSQFYYQLMHKSIALKGVLKFTLKQLQHVSVYSPSLGSALYKLAKVTILKTVN